ncbi:transporter substrate-binding domain-containing protein (plasmid) [Rhizobium sp. 32-5/1]|uniref:transporter substrate-binding domain-containing protein n=1 Tax=Rhizobium sp. 32-5/1 TaxID=3019602 RepID=UPI00240E27F1|nr:transporter substrate-binding domain-containing protein [Rhizobium sp. 32-5/1]WEZ85362.1 transporter substrate-binding domain-containing protein [Rhizobium sp. 32-5/1]
MRKYDSAFAMKSAARLSLMSLGVALFVGFGAQAAQPNKEIIAMLPSSIKETGIVKVATPMQVPPNIFLENGVLKGEAVDLVRAIEPILNVKFEFDDMQWPGVIPGIQSGNYDMSIGVMSYTPDREAIMDMVVYRSNVSGVLVLKDHAAEIQVPSDLCGKPVATVQAAALLKQLELESKKCEADGASAINIKTYPSTGMAMVALKGGSAVAYPASTGELAYGESTSAGVLVRRNFSNWVGNPQAVAVSKSTPGLADAIALAFRELHASGEYQAILAKYGLDANIIKKEEMRVNPSTAK